MHPASLDVTTVHDADEARLVFTGELDLTSAYVVDAELRRALADGARNVIFDLSAIPALGMSGVRTLIDGARVTREGGAQMRLSGLGGGPRALVDALSAQVLLGLDR